MLVLTDWSNEIMSVHSLLFYRFSHGSQLDVMMLWMWDGLDYQILMFMKESFWAAHSIRVVLEYGLLISRYFSNLCFRFAGFSCFIVLIMVSLSIKLLICCLQLFTS